jgi:tetratricopeptide (TPR) repeat protein
MSKDWIQYPAGVGVVYPTSGQLVGLVAGFLRLKGYLREGWEGASYKTAQRYFEGKRIAPESIDKILDALVAALVPEGAVGVNARVARAGARSFLGNAVRHWDVLVGSMLGGGFPIIEPRLAPIPFLRLFILDAAIRWAAYQALATHTGGEPEFRPPWLESDGVRQAMDRYRCSTAGETLSVTTCAASAKVSDNSLEAWRRGDQLPTNENLQFLAAPLAKHASRPPGEVEFQLRVAVGVGALRRFLAELCGEHVVTDLVDTFPKVARYTHDWLRLLPIPEELFIPVMHEIIEYGAHATIRDRLSKHLADRSARHAEVQADFLALPGRWGERLNYWAKMMTAFGPTGGFLNHLPGLTGEEKQRLRPEIEERVLRMRHFDEEEAAHPHLYNAPDDANTRAKREAIQGHRARSWGNIEKAAEHLRRATRHDPVNAAYHYDLGCYLGEWVAKGELKHLDEAISACRMAARLDPTWNSPLTEIAIMLSNVGRFEEALQAFEEAEPVAKDWAHFHFTRGNTLMWLMRYEEAAVAFRRTLEIKPLFLDAKINLAVALTALGRHKDAEKLAPEIAHHGGPRCNRPEQWLAHFPRMSPLAEKRHQGVASIPTVPGASARPRTTRFAAPRVGRNEACPCGSGKKFKHCCSSAPQ